MKSKREESAGAKDGSLPPSCPQAASYVAAANRTFLEFEEKCAGLREDIVGCLLVSTIVFRGDYVPRGREPSEAESRLATCAVFRDFWKHAPDLLQMAGWWPALVVPEGEVLTAFRRFWAWRQTHFEATLRWDEKSSAPDRVQRTRAIWNHLTKCAMNAGRVDAEALRNDIRKTLTEAGLRGADGRDPLTKEDLKAEAALIERATDQAGKSTIYYDRRGRGRISWRTCKDLHPNRGQRMPKVEARTELGQVLHGRGATGDGEGSGQTEMDRDLIAADTLRQAQAEAGAIQSERDAALDMEWLLEALRPLVRARGTAAEAALAYLVPLVLRRGKKIARHEACQVFTPPVTADALRHQEKWLRPRLDQIAARVDLE